MGFPNNISGLCKKLRNLSKLQWVDADILSWGTQSNSVKIEYFALDFWTIHA